MTDNNKFLTYISHFIVIIVILILCGLGTWQVARYNDKQVRIAQIETRAEQGVLDHSRLASLPLDDVRDVQVQVQPLQVSEQVMWLDNRQRNGRVGYELIVPVQTESGWLLANMGWRQGRKDRLSLPAVPLLTELNDELIGAVSVPGLNRFVQETAVNDGQFPKVIQQIEFNGISALLGQPLLPYMLTVTQTHPDFERQWQPVVMAPQKHLGYALQWFGLAIAAGVIYWIARRRISTREHLPNP